MIKNILTALLLTPVAVVLISHAQTSQDPCPSGTPKCYSDLAPYAGHDLSASQLPPTLCPNGCEGDNRRVIVVRMDSSWGSPTNANHWNAVQCALAAWNNATDGVSDCRSIMFGVNTNGSRDVDTVQPGDVTQVNRNFNSATRSNCQTTTPANGVAPEPLVTPTPTPTPPECYDIDGDGYGEGFGCNGPDCDDSNPNIHWGAYLGTCTTGFSIGFRDWNCNGEDDYYEMACQSPILVDVAGNGFDLTSAKNGVMFDIDGDGVVERLSWTNTGTDDAWLALDRNQNGLIERGPRIIWELHRAT